MTTRAGDAGELVSGGRTLYCVVTQPMLFRTAAGKRFLSLGYNLGVSEDGGRKWTLLAAGNSATSRADLKRLLPDLPDAVVIPRMADPLLLDE